jgi:trans-aconitate methyltransferase
VAHCTEDLPTGFDLVHARWLVEWLPNKRQALTRMVAALRPGGVLLVEEPDFVTIFGAAEPPALRHVVVCGMRHLEDNATGCSISKTRTSTRHDGESRQVNVVGWTTNEGSPPSVRRRM